jgi:hypothetical protein
VSDGDRGGACGRQSRSPSGWVGVDWGVRVLRHVDLSPGKLRKPFDAVIAAIEADDFKTADVKKLASGGFYRARLDYANRLLLRFAAHGGEKVCLALELIEQHAYDRSRFLRGAAIDEDKLVEVTASAEQVEATPLRYLHPSRSEFHYLDKPISFDDAQSSLLELRPPAVIVGSAGSGKTALTLEKLRSVPGRVAYITQSAFLAESSRALYYAHGWSRDDQEAEFLSLRGLIESIAIPPGRAVTFRDFAAWFPRVKGRLPGADAHQVFEEIRGVLTAQPEGPLDRERYAALGVRESIFGGDARAAVYSVFEQYRAMLAGAGLFDPNLAAHALLARATPRFDFVVVDEVQDLTNVELALVLRTLGKPGQFLIAGDSNQIVHPNFFSWSKVKSMFWRDAVALAPAASREISVLSLNYRNGRAVTRVANALLKIKHARFGSIDRESNHLVRAAAEEEGVVSVLPSEPKLLAELDAKIRGSTQFAVIVLRDEHKEEARRVFRTPLLFSIHEAKGLEYESVVLHRLISSERGAYRDICDGVRREDLSVEELAYRRPADKEDKSAEVYKFYVNALYVALTRAVKNVYLVESDSNHPLLELLEVRPASDASSVTAKASSVEEWQREARRLEQQGKQEQAEAIRANILKTTPVPWTVLDEGALREHAGKAFAPNSSAQKSKQILFEFACVYDEPMLAERVARAGYATARPYHELRHTVARKYTAAYQAKNFKDILWQTERHGVDFRTPVNLTPLMLAAGAGNVALVEALLSRGARLDLVDTFGTTALHHALAQAYLDPDFARDRLGALYDLLAPQKIELSIDGRAVTLGRHQGEYFYFAATFALLRHEYTRWGASPEAVTSSALTIDGLEKFPGSVVMPHRKKRSYVNALIAKSEVGAGGEYNRRLWRRVRHGHYVPNLEASIRTVDRDGAEIWEPIGERLRLPLLEALRGYDDYRDKIRGVEGH